ncbi:T-complex-associated testis-expressed protein 1 [Fasciola hepatica]|uniref:T-complex-associated testis-expressed protein 1 n=1 Tax=Fasciola hepatica TaxID=6192 RepID=A0A4E0R2M4_FASHE|nr:T-complex-associated testis-expressed protein 1 [Fasciola hepatica]
MATEEKNEEDIPDELPDLVVGTSTKTIDDEQLQQLGQTGPTNTTGIPLFDDSTIPAPSNRASKLTKSTEKFNNDTRVMRRIIAEDPAYNLDTVLPLTDLCLKHCIENFEYNSKVMSYLNGRQRRQLLDTLAPDLPLKVTSHVIGEDPYWRRCCNQRWAVVDLSRHGGLWKQAFFERMLEETLETFVPGYTYAPRLEECVSYAAPYVHRLHIRQLLPPLKPQPRGRGSDEGSDADSDSELSGEPQMVDHVELGPVVGKLKCLEELAVSYTVKDCGMNFEWSMFQFTNQDCIGLSKAIQNHSVIRILHITRSRMDSDRCRVLVDCVLDHPTLEFLDLSHNFIGDRGARALSKLISGRSKLKTLNLADNRLQATGGLALAHSLTKKSCLLLRLNLRLNRLRDDGGTAIAKSLLRNSCLKELNLAANDLNENAASYFAHVLAHNTTLTHLDLSNNQIGPAGSKKLQDGMSRNETLLHLDLRFTGGSQEAGYSICQQIERNQDNMRQTQLDLTRTYNTERTEAGLESFTVPVGITSVANRHTEAGSLLSEKVLNTNPGIFSI